MTTTTSPATSFDRAFQNLFTVIADVIALYRQRQAVDGGGSEDLSPNTVEENLHAYKVVFDSTGPEIHVDMVLELYGKVRASLHRGYQCDSWLRNGEVLYYGVSPAEAGQRVVQLTPVFLMLEALKRSDSQTRSQATVLRMRFANQLYTLFMTALRYSKGVTQETLTVTGDNIDEEIKLMEAQQTEILNDLPKASSSVAAAAGPAGGAAANPLAGLASLFPGGLSDVMGSLLQTLPSITRNVTEAVSRTTGTPISDSDQQMIDSTMSNITSVLGNPDGMRSMLADMNNGPDGISRFVQRILSSSSAPSQAAAGSAPPALD